MITTAYYVSLYLNQLFSVFKTGIALTAKHTSPGETYYEKNPKNNKNLPNKAQVHFFLGDLYKGYTVKKLITF